MLYELKGFERIDACNLQSLLIKANDWLRENASRVRNVQVLTTCHGEIVVAYEVVQDGDAQEGTGIIG